MIYLLWNNSTSYIKAAIKKKKNTKNIPALYFSQVNKIKKDTQIVMWPRYRKE